MIARHGAIDGRPQRHLAARDDHDDHGPDDPGGDRRAEQGREPRAADHQEDEQHGEHGLARHLGDRRHPNRSWTFSGTDSIACSM